MEPLDLPAQAGIKIPSNFAKQLDGVYPIKSERQFDGVNKNKKSFSKKTIIILVLIILVLIGGGVYGWWLIKNKNITTNVVPSIQEQVQNTYKAASDSYNQAFANGVSASQRNQLFDQSQQDLDTVLKNQPDNVDALNKIVAIFYEKEDYSSAEKYLLQYIPSNPNDTYLINLLAYTYGQEKKYTLAEEYYSKSLLIDPMSVNTYLDFSSLYLAENKKNEAINLLNTGLQNLPDNVGLKEKLNFLNK